MSTELNRGACALCLKDAVLKDSHLTPQWIYRRIRDAGNGKDDPVRVANGSACMTSQQVKKTLLCEECEDRFGKREDYVARLTATGTAQLLQYVTIVDESMTGAVELNRDEIDTEKLSYFAISIIWRSCFIAGGCSLGKYQEQFRKYLIGKDEFPHFAALTMTIIKPSETAGGDVNNMYTQPSSGRDGLLWFHGFSLFGLMFRCFVGKTLESDWKEQVCLVGPNPKKYALLQTSNQCADHRSAVDTLLNAQPRGKLHQKIRTRSRSSK
ncbi:hypothetical protein ACO0LC_22280 [Undibacterium sp. JH2W]|uniref:hypothetical protein n=1 Tax=Undibacterium sp. JH2W TaxID=3413037 RepID=UPI003BF32472